MSLPPLNPDKSTAGIVLDPTTLERVVPSSRRKDGTTRKELKIRPGFTPQEDVGRFRGSRQSAADARVGLVPGSNRPAPPKQPNPENPFAQPVGLPKEKSKAQLKNEKRRAAKREKAEVSVAWDEMDDSSEEEKVKPSTAEETYATGGAPLVELATSPPIRDPTEHLDTTDAALNNNAPPIPSPGEIAGPASAAFSPIETEKAWKAAGSRDSSPAARGTGGPPVPRQGRAPGPKQTTGGGDKGRKPHPIQGGRQGPLGLAHPPAPPQKTKAEFPELGGGKAAPAKKPEEPRVRKEVKVREGGANDLSSLSSRLRGMVIANAAQESPRQRRERVASEASKEGGGAAQA